MGRRGPHPVSIHLLRLWEWQWFWVFRGLRYGAPSRLVVRMDYLQYPDKPRISGYRELDEERQKAWRVTTEKASRAYYRKDPLKDVPTRPLPSEKTLWDSLMRARTIPQVRATCAKSRSWLNPEWQGKVFVQKLHQHADQFLLAKRDLRYPRSNRPSSDDRRILFFARAMAGITLGRSPNTAIRMLGATRHGPNCPCPLCHLRSRAQEDLA